jgi:hypothetical protein
MTSVDKVNTVKNASPYNPNLLPISTLIRLILWYGDKVEL